MKLFEIISDYILTHDLKPGSESYYRRCAKVFKNYLGYEPDDLQFSANLVNTFIRDKTLAGKSPYYCRSLRNALRALLRHVHPDCGRLRPVKCRELLNDTWSPEDVTNLAAAAKSKEMRLLILVAYYTGLSGCDLRRLERKHVANNGVIHFARQKTGKRVVVAIPPELLPELPTEGLLFPLRTTEEWFRRCFQGVVKRAGLCGTFKKLRRSSGTAIEMMHPGRGHIHLGNTRSIFETNYLDKQRDVIPMMPPRAG